MTRHLTAIIEREGDGYVALCPELDIASQGTTVAEAREYLKEALELFFETAPATEIQHRLHEEVYVTKVEIAVGLTHRAYDRRRLDVMNAISPQMQRSWTWGERLVQSSKRTGL